MNTANRATSSVAIVVVCVGVLALGPSPTTVAQAGEPADKHPIPAQSSATVTEATEIISTELDDARGESDDRALDRWVISQLGEEPNDQGDDGEDGMVPVRWEPGVGFVRKT